MVKAMSEKADLPDKDVVAERRKQSLKMWKEVVRKRRSEGGEPSVEAEGGEGGALEAFTKAAEAYGAFGMRYERLEDGSEVLRQNLGEGWHGMGYDGANVWMGLTAQGERYDWNANTLLRPGEEYRGINTGEKGRLSADHPLAQLYSGLKDREGVEVHVTGFHAGWGRSEETLLSPDEEGNLIGNIPEGSEIKAVVTNVEAEWFDGGPPGEAWKGGQEQQLTIRPASSG